MPIGKVQRAAVCLIAIGVSAHSCKDLGSDPAKGALTATTLSITLTPGGNANVTITGGNPPYRISRQPDASLVTATLTNNPNGTGSLVVQAVSASVSGTTSVKIKDSDSHGSAYDGPGHEENEIEIVIRVSPPGSGISFSNDIQPIFNSNCTGCHGDRGGLSLAQNGSYANLVNVQAQTGCATLRRVLPGDATSSVLFKRVSGFDCGERMPRGGNALPSADVTKIRDWINQGAPNN